MSVKQVFNTSAELDYPTVLPTLDLDFANSKTLDPRITFTRASGGSYVGADGLIKYAGVNEARFDHDPVTGESLGLLVEEARTNLYVFSENPESAFFQPELVSFSINSAIAPDGNLTADKIITPVGAAGPSISQGINITSGATLTGSIFVRYADLDRLEIVLLSNNNTTPYARATINPINGTITTAVAAFNGGTNPSARVVSYGNGWYRFSVTVTYPAVTLAGMRVAASDSGGALGDGISGIYIWGAQLEQGSFPTSYIPTVASTRTRAADNASITGKNFSEWYRQDESTIYCEFNAYNLMSTFIRTIFSINGPEPLGLNRIQLNLNGSGGGGTTQPIYHNLYQNGPNYTDYLGIPYVKGPIKTTMRYKDKDTFMATASNIFARNNNPSLQSIPLTKTMTSLNIGQFTGAISRITYFPKAIPQSQLLSLTS
jgi:hypothetical protein